MAMDGTTTMNFVQPYLRFNSNMVFVYTNVLPVPVSISTSQFDGAGRIRVQLRGIP